MPGVNSIRSLKKRIGINAMHLEERKGTQKQAIEYTQKDGDWMEIGVKRMDRSRETENKNKILPFMDYIRSGRMEELASHPDCSAYILKHAKEVYTLLEEPRDVDVPLNVHWYWGPTGTGKTRRAWYEANKKGKVYIKSSGSKWFDGYDGEENIIFDDLRSSWFEFSFLLKLLDRYPFRVECKGGSRQWKGVNIWVTCPMKPDEMYTGLIARDNEYNEQSTEEKRDQIAQLLRRVHKVEHMPLTPFGSWVEPLEQTTDVHRLNDENKWDGKTRCNVDPLDDDRPKDMSLGRRPLEEISGPDNFANALNKLDFYKLDFYSQRLDHELNMTVTVLPQS